MKILLFGHRGQVGNAIEKRSKSQHTLLPISCDITDYQTVETNIRSFRPDVIINCAAYTHVDDAEMHKDKAFAVNALAPQYIAQCAKNFNSLFVHFSTDYVFDGLGYTPWTEEDTPAPINTYGSTKLEGDLQIINSGCRYLVIRTSWIYGQVGNNFIKSILEQAKTKNNIKVVCDQIGAPTSASFLADSVLSMVEAAITNDNLLGLYNVVPQGETSWADYAQFIIQTSELSSSVQITPILSSHYPKSAKRPLNSRLNTEKFQKTFGIHPPNWKQDVIKFLYNQDEKNEV